MSELNEKPMLWPDYPSMVGCLFKLMPGHGAVMLHACIGIAGETGELRMSTKRDGDNSIFEECGDLEFYIEAAWQAVVSPKVNRLEMVSKFQVIAENEVRVTHVNIGNVMDNIHSVGADILDHAKKVWVYEDGNRDEKIGTLLCVLEFNLLKLYELLGTTRADIRAQNMAKLGKRYATKQYSNEQALARADKDPMEGRSFIGQHATSANN